MCGALAPENHEDVCREAQRHIVIRHDQIVRAISKTLCCRTALEVEVEQTPFGAQDKRRKYPTFGGLFTPLAFSPRGLMKLDTAKAYKAIPKPCRPNRSGVDGQASGIGLVQRKGSFHLIHCSGRSSLRSWGVR